MKQGGFFYLIKIIIILALISAGFFYAQKILASESILISEIQITGGAGKTENDFIELYNPNNYQVNLKGYRLVKRIKTGATDTSIKSWTNDTYIQANGHYLWANSNYTNISSTPDITTADTISSNNGIALRLGALDTGVIIDSVGWGEAQNVFVEGNVFPITNQNIYQSVQRRFENNTIVDTGDNASDFEITNCPNPKAQAAVCQSESGQPVVPVEPAPVSSENTATSTSAAENPSNPPLQGGQKINLGDLLINEFISDPADNEVEWIELYNKTSREIDLTGWWLEDGGKAKTNLSGGFDKYKVIEKPGGNLNNAGDIIALYDASGKIIDQTAYGNWDDGNPADNAPAAGDPGSTARKFDGYNTFNNLNDFAATLKPTKGAANIIEAEDEISAEAKAGFDFSGDIFISEILPNPAGDDTKLEFIEIYNAGQRQVDLIGWSLSNENDKKVNFEKFATSTIIKAGEYLAFFRPRTKIVLHNDQGEIKLFQPLADKPFISVDYKNTKEGWSYNLETSLLKGGGINDNWVWSETITPGQFNLFKTINHPPEVEFSPPKEVLIGRPAMFDSSDTVDQDNDKLKYAWDFGDGFKNSLANPEHTYLKIGIYKVKLEVSDGQATSTKEKSVKVVSSVSEMNNEETPLTPILKGNEGGIIINEIMPNPAGADTGNEWLELKNQSEAEINLLNWRVENSNGQYKFDSAQPLAIGSFYILNDIKSKLAFKNTDDTIALYNGLDELIDQVKYAGAVQGEAYARGVNGKWFWTTVATPAEENVISLAESAYVEAAAGKAKNGNAGIFMETDLEKVRELEIGSLIKVKGTVAVTPGVLGAQIFYIVGSPGLQIYNYKKDFPALRIGDYIEVAGELAEAQGEFRIKTKDKSGINLVEHKAPPVALAIKADEVSEENIGQLITVSGEITDKKSASLYVDDGSDEIFVYIKQNTGIDAKSLAAGQKAAVSGILSKTKTGLRLLPRYQADIILIDSASGTELEPQVLGEVASSREWDLAERDKKLELFKYLLILAAGAIIVLVGLFIKIKRKNP